MPVDGAVGRLSGTPRTVSFRPPMPRIDDLPADRRPSSSSCSSRARATTTSPRLLRIEPEAVRERARDALDASGRTTAPSSTTAEQDEIADYLLGPAVAPRSARRRATSSRRRPPAAPGRASCRASCGRWRGDGLPEIPAERAEVDEAFDALEARKVARERQSQELAPRRRPAPRRRRRGRRVPDRLRLSGRRRRRRRPAAPPRPRRPTQTDLDRGTGGQQVLGQINLNPVEGSPAPRRSPRSRSSARATAIGDDLPGPGHPAPTARPTSTPCGSSTPRTGPPSWASRRGSARPAA